MDTLADRVRGAIKRAGVAALVDSTGLSRATLYKLAKSASSPTVRTLRKLRAGGLTIPRDLLDAA